MSQPSNTGPRVALVTGATSDRSSYVTGALFPVDGGRTAV
jgi:hypothetical protein